MGKRINKRIVAVLLSLVLILGLFGIVDINVYADNEYPSGGLLLPEIIYNEISEEEYNDILEEEVSKQSDSGTLRLYKGNDSYWSKFSAPHYNYTNSLTSTQKTFYNNLYNALYGMIDGGSDCAPIYDKDNVLQCNAGTPEVSYSGLTKSQAEDVVYLIIYGRPELYFLDSIIQISYTNSNTGSVRIGVYDDFATCASRSIAASRIRSRIDWYLNQVNDGASAYDKEKKIHDLLIAYCTYGNESSTPYSQSCASVFLNANGETVCAGYSEAFCMLCYAKGIPAYSVTSSYMVAEEVKGHEWSQVRLGSYWYAVDVTWDDSSSSNRHFNKSDATMLRLGRNDHTIEALWSRVGRDACLYDYGNEPSPIPTRGVTSGIYVGSHTYNNISAGLAIEGTSYNNLEYFWMAYDVGANTWYTISDWNGSTNWVNWNPTKAGAFWLLGKARWATTKEEATSTCIGIMHSGNEIFPNVSSGVYIPNETYNNVQAGLAISGASVSDLDYMWMAYDVKNNSWSVISDWTRGNNWVNWNPGKTGWFWLLGRARWTGTSVEATSTCIALNHKQCISGKCITPNPGWAPGWLVGLSTFDNPNNSYRYEVQILDCTRLLLGDPNPWVYSTGPMNIGGANTAWTSWQPYPGNYWTLFRIYDAYGNILDEECYGFVA